IRNRCPERESAGLPWDEEHRVYNTLPLFNTVNYLEQAGQPYPIFMRQDSARPPLSLSHILINYKNRFW
ncbi:hypothetical protein, partial [Alistipes indistinctus]|uniref:hypothetical protein n=1 Tax=Alistipes indistinctus TaxID=626932 RepID=UPI003AB5B0E3